MNNKSSRTAICAAIGLTVFVAIPVKAQTAPTADSTGDEASNIEEVVVTARRVEERAQDVPISMTVFNQQQLNEHNITSGADLATYTPSLSTNTEFGSEGTSFALRGFRQEIDTTASVAVYFADVVAPRGGASINTGDGAGPGSFFDLQNVQVLKGPQGTLFGRNTDGGAILLVPQKPTSSLGGYVDAGYGNHGMLRVQAVANLPLNDTFRMRFGMDHENRDGWMKNLSGVGPTDFNDINYTAARASAVWDITPNLENYTIASFVNSDHNGSAQKLVACNPNSSLGSLFACAQVAQDAGKDFWTTENDMPLAKTKMQQWQLINTTTWSQSDSLTVKNIASYAHLTNTVYNDLFNTNWKMPAQLYAPGYGYVPDPFAGVPVIFANVFTAAGHKINDMADMTEEFQLQGHLYDSRLVWQAGAYGEFNEPQSATGVTSAQAINCTNQLAVQCFDVLGTLSGHPGDGGQMNYGIGNTRFHDFGIYEQSSYSLTSKLKLTEGLRYTMDSATAHQDFAYYRFPNPEDPSQRSIYCWSAESPYAFKAVEISTPAPSVNSCPTSFQQDSKAPTWMLGLDYKPTDDILLYVKYARGYRQGSVAPTAAEGYNVFQPEKVNTYEIGSKTSFSKGVHGTFDVSAFYNDFKDQQIGEGFQCPSENPTCGGAPALGIVNAGKSRMWGFEVESTISPFKGARLALSYAYLNTKLISIGTTPLPTSSPYYGKNCSGVYDPSTGTCSGTETLNAPSATSDVGGEIALTPKNKLTATASYLLPLASSIGRVSVTASYAYQSGMILSSYEATPFYKAAAYGLTSLNLDWTAIAGSRFDAGLFASNVFDQRYVVFSGGLYNGAGFESEQLGEPRMYGGRIRMNFGN